MPKARSPDRDKAFELYKSSGGEMPMHEIAAQLNVPESTVRAWKTKDKWDGKSNGALRKNTERSKRKNPKLQKLSEPLEENHRLFAEAFVECCVAGKAYKAVYPDSSPGAARVSACRLLQRPEVTAYVEELRRQKAEAVLFHIEDIVDRMMRIAFAEITDVVEFGRVAVPVMGSFGPVMIKVPGSKEKVPMQKIVNDVRFKESWDVDAAVISQVKMGKDGASVKLEDRMKAMTWLADYFGHNPESNRRAEFENKKLELAERQVKVQEDKVKGGTLDTAALMDGLRQVFENIENPRPDRSLEDYE